MNGLTCQLSSHVCQMASHSPAILEFWPWEKMLSLSLRSSWAWVGRIPSHEVLPIWALLAMHARCWRCGYGLYGSRNWFSNSLGFILNLCYVSCTKPYHDVRRDVCLLPSPSFAKHSIPKHLGWGVHPGFVCPRFGDVTFLTIRGKRKRLV